MSGSRIGRLVRVSVVALTAYGCGSTHDTPQGGGGSGGVSGAPSAGSSTGGDMQPAAGTSTSGGSPTNAAGAAGSATDGNGAAAGASGEGGEGGEAAAPSGGAGGSDGTATAAEVAKSCTTPVSTLLTLDDTFGWKTAALRIDLTVPSCELQPGVGVGTGGNVLYFAHESNDTYSIWTDAPWSFELEAGQSANELPQQKPITVFPFLDDLRLRVVFSLGNDAVTVSSVTAE